MNGEEIIKVEHLTKEYMIYDNPADRLKDILGFGKKKRGTSFYALNDVSFSVKKGRTLAIIGENGAGKSTLLKIITGVLNQTEGKVTLKGKVAALLELGTGFNPEYTGIENIYLNGSVLGLEKENIDSRVEDILSFADIGEFANQKVKTYSSGMFARLAFSVAIHVEPDILIVDEALAVGDLFFQQKCNMYMKEKMSNCTKLLVTHDMASVANMADDAIVLKNGKCVFVGEPLKAIEFYTKQAHSELFQSQKEVEEKSVSVITDGVLRHDKFKNISEESLGGALDARIVSYDLLVNDKEYEGYVQRNDIIRVLFNILSVRTIEKAMIGYQIKDKYGNTIFGENTHSSGFKECKIEADKEYVVSIEFKWPQVQENTYFLTLGIGEGTHEMQHIIQCWAHNIAELNAISDMPNHGVFNNVIKKFNIEEK